MQSVPSFPVSPCCHGLRIHQNPDPLQLNHQRLYYRPNRLSQPRRHYPLATCLVAVRRRLPCYPDARVGIVDPTYNRSAASITTAAIRIHSAPGRSRRCNRRHAPKIQRDAVATAPGDAAAPERAAAPALADWKGSITKNTIRCLECGDTFKQLSLRHLTTHDLDPRSYRAKYNIPRSQALSARSTTARRRELAQTIRPWELAPSKTQNGATTNQAATNGRAKTVAKTPAKATTKAAAGKPRARKVASGVGSTSAATG